MCVKGDKLNSSTFIFLLRPCQQWGALKHLQTQKRENKSKIHLRATSCSGSPLRWRGDWHDIGMQSLSWMWTGPRPSGGRGPACSGWGCFLAPSSSCSDSGCGSGGSSPRGGCPRSQNAAGNSLQETGETNWSLFKLWFETNYIYSSLICEQWLN